MIGTWPYDFKGFYGYRNFIIKNECEDVIAVANSTWIYMDTNTGRPAKVPDDHAGYTLEPAYPMEPVSRKIDISDPLVSYPPFEVRKSNIDSYNHVNNGQYIKMAEEYLPAHFHVSSMRVEYRMQAVYADMIIPLVSEYPECVKVVLANKDRKPFSIIVFDGERY